MVAHVCDKLFAGTDLAHVAITVLIQHFLAFFWFSALFGSLFSYYLTADKGVTRFSKVKTRYPMLLSVGGSLIAAGFRSFAIIAFLNLSGAKSLAEFHTVAGIVGFIVTSMQHHSFWEQRPLPLILISAGSEFACTLAAATAFYYMRLHNVKLF